MPSSANHHAPKHKINSDHVRVSVVSLDGLEEVEAWSLKGPAERAMREVTDLWRLKIDAGWLAHRPGVEVRCGKARSVVRAER